MRVAILAAMLPAGCAIRAPSVDQQLIFPEGGAKYEMDPRQAFRFPLPIDNLPPELPAASQRRELPPTSVCADVWLSAQGLVERVVPLHGIGECDAASRPEFADLEQAVVSSVRQWRFQPAAICTFADAARRERSHGDCSGTGVEITPVALRLSYVFTFEIRNGKRHVGASRIAGE